jgi:hypothetical protein
MQNIHMYIPLSKFTLASFSRETCKGVVQCRPGLFTKEENQTLNFNSVVV